VTTASPLDGEDAEHLRACVAGGGVAVFPTDTVYGVCCDPDDAAAAQRLYQLKGRPAARPAAVMFFALDHAVEALPELTAFERGALGAMLPGPVTVLLENRSSRFLAACRTDPTTVGLRVPWLPESLHALCAIEEPVMQSSANISGQADARMLEDVPSSLREGADLVLDGGTLPGTPSTVVDLRDYEQSGAWHVLREGALAATAVGELLRAAR
jgi:L-threonylcarbamoyladenylate synthase